MPDIFSKEIRSKIMRAVKSKGTKIEDAVAHELFKNGVRFRRNVKDLLGKPDIAIKKYKIVIFIDSCFWHGCPEHFKKPKTNKKFWNEKIMKNIQRDTKITQYYNDSNWHILRIWGHQLKNDYNYTIKYIVDYIKKNMVI